MHDGIAQMFDVIEHARMLVGTKAIGTLSTGYLTALDYARQRVQGADLTRMADRTAPRVPIIQPPGRAPDADAAEGLRRGAARAVPLHGLVRGPGRRAAGRRGRRRRARPRCNDLLLPIVKGVGSERATEMLQLSLQTLGGSGYLQDYPIEQYLRDAKIDSLYEGTTAIQSLDLLFRKIVRDQGRRSARVVAEIEAFLDAPDSTGGGHGRLKEERALLGTALADVQGHARGHAPATCPRRRTEPASVYKAGQHSVRLLLAVGDLLVGWLLLRQAEVALTALDGPARAQDQAFYQGKVAAARFFAHTVLPRLTADRAVLETPDNALMDLPAAAF